ncbi:germination-specific N-acetylmuramoyl-L-alanine amidase precursor [Oxobacter pfennigii]|uniref:Germination-specific N-acetylmuramoyl-L-alanine amidase n=1 Tax=Oxobacter pfennigii TaxID=36849 RepID=A0A0P8YGY7_9CLOT|nr:N-acetylmuramoyl-L-alanine amidase CwlD [Oxobacter pfennigii]KPU46351.1 germination-specific N-acetylmuramoyl-L-alanine amidase precursor [Oxobacter pfennigii]
MSGTLKKVLGLIIISMLIIILNILFGDVKNASTIPVGNKIVVIDAGHGGRDAGASGKAGLEEKDINLLIAKKLKAYIEESGGTVIMIREEDEGLYSEESRNKKREDMQNRKKIILDSSADVFISIHLNSFPEGKYHGAQVFYPKGPKSSQWLARVMQQELRRVLDKNNDRVEKSNDTYFIIKDNGIPSVLIECGFLSNAAEEKLLGQGWYQEKIAWSIYIGLLRYFSEPIPDVIPGEG